MLLLPPPTEREREREGEGGMEGMRDKYKIFTVLCGHQHSQETRPRSDTDLTTSMEDGLEVVGAPQGLWFPQ